MACNDYGEVLLTAVDTLFKIKNYNRRKEFQTSVMFFV